MSELIQKNDSRATIRWKLLTGASALALTAYVSSAALAKADDASQPQVWIELGGQFSRLQDGQELFTPQFVSLTTAPFSQPQKSTKPPLYGLSESAALTFQPEGSDWIFSASIQYGRPGSNKHVHHQSYPPILSYYIRNLRKNTIRYFPVYPSAGRFTDAAVRQSESHAILDFQVGKDVGLGMFGAEASSSLSAGVRIAQFRSKSNVSLSENPDWHTSTNLYSIGTPPRLIIQHVYQGFHSFAGTFRADRNFSGMGPSLSWKSSVPFAGNSQDGALSVDWGVNAAILFGRQKTKTQHQTTGDYKSGHAPPYPQITYQHPAVPLTRSRNVTVPNVGGFAGISYNYADAKLSFGYKADFFFGAIDGGIDAQKSENRAFNGPYASISIGLGG